MRESGNEGVEGRLEMVLRGRKPHPWGNYVRIKRTTVTRMMKGQFPDPRALVPMLRIERLSLTWLLTGAGTPYLVLAPAHDAEAATEVAMRLADEASWTVLLAHCDEGFCVVLHQPASSMDIDGRDYAYTATEVIGGAACGPLVLGAVLDEEFPRRITQVELAPSDWRRLASGRMGNTELWGWEREPGGLASNATPLLTARAPNLVFAKLTAVADGAAVYHSDEEHELLHIIRGCKPCERETILRMVRALR